MTLPSHPDRSFPRLHPRPAKGWLNDPNGIHHDRGRWQVFFQYNPDSARHQRITWGQVSSDDLLNWRDEGVAIRPQPGAGDEYGCWTGVCVIDAGVPTLVYSGVRDETGPSEVMLARLEADGFRQSPRVAAPMPDDRSVTTVRDPFLFEHGGRRWGIQGAGLASGEPAVLLYDATDLESWRYLGVMLDGTDEVAATLPRSEVWECPQLVAVDGAWVLIVSRSRYGQPVAVDYLLGSLTVDPGSGLPRFSPRSGGSLDGGPSFYAPQAVQAGDRDGGAERVLVWGWAREIAGEGVRGRSEAEADAVGWSGTLTSVCELVVDGYAVRLVPARELVRLRGEAIDPASALPDQAEILLRGPGTAELRLAADGEPGQTVWRGDLGEHTTRLLIDASLVEVFGLGSTTLRAYPAPGEAYRLIADPGTVIDAWQLRLPAGSQD